MAEHTPGPWDVDLETGEITTETSVLGTIYGADDYPCHADDISAECKANARLMAAAPELLAACVIAEKILDEYGIPDERRSQIQAAIETAKAIP